MQTPQSNMVLSAALDALIQQRRDLSEAESHQAMQAILSGSATEAQMSSFLVALHLKGETAEELTGAARALREAARTPAYPSLAKGPLVDTCGTGGDRSGTFNISTVSAFVVAGAGVPVAKHGNRSLSSTCGSADLLESLGVDLERASNTLATAGLAFFFAPLFHGATRHVQAVRARLKIRTIFNYLGPLTNPAGANTQVAGAFSTGAASLIARALADLGLPRGFAVHGTDGLDEVTLSAPTDVFEVRGGQVFSRQLSPSDFNLPPAGLDSLQGGSVARNREIALSVLNGAPGPQRNIVLANAGLALYAAQVAATLPAAVAQAAHSIDSGRAAHVLTRLQEI